MSDKNRSINIRVFSLKINTFPKIIPYMQKILGERKTGDNWLNKKLQT